VYRAYVAFIQFLLDRGARIDAPSARIELMSWIFCDLQICKVCHCHISLSANQPTLSHFSNDVICWSLQPQ
jgi:hypothetical protein